MWKPVGCLPWRDVFADFHRITEQVLSGIYGTPHEAAGKGRYINTTERFLVKAGVATSYEEASLTIALVATFLMDNFMDEFPPLVVSIEGRNLELDWIFFTHRDRFDLCYFDWPPKENGQFSSFFTYQAANKFGPSDLYQRFVFVNYETGMFRASNGAAAHLRNQIGLDEASVSDALKVAESAKGYLVCWPEPFDQSAMREFLAILEVNEDFTRELDLVLGQRQVAEQGETTVGSSQKRGRPPKTPDALHALRQCFPNGISGLTMKQIWRGIEEHSGMRFSERTVGRAVKLFRSNGKTPS